MRRLFHVSISYGVLGNAAARAYASANTLNDTTLNDTPLVDDDGVDDGGVLAAINTQICVNVKCTMIQMPNMVNMAHDGTTYAATQQQQQL